MTASTDAATRVARQAVIGRLLREATMDVVATVVGTVQAAGATDCERLGKTDVRGDEDDIVVHRIGPAA